MSRPASDWAWCQNLDRASTKLLLLALANRADKHGECFPGILRIANDTGLNRKTVMAGLQKLQQLDLIIDTGKRRGSRGRVRVWRLCIHADFYGTKDEGSDINRPKNGMIDGLNRSKTGTMRTSNEPENGMTIDPENGTSNQPKNGSQKQSVETVSGINQRHVSAWVWAVSNSPFIDETVRTALENDEDGD